MAAVNQYQNLSAKQPARITNYDEFWLHYLREHSLPQTRALHYIGTSIGILIWTYSLYIASFKLAPLGLLAGYFAAWVAHFFIEHNKPATFKYPGWSFVSDFKMLGHFLTGTLQPHLRKAGVQSAAAAAKQQ